VIVTGAPRSGFKVIVKVAVELLAVAVGVVVDVDVRARLV